MDRSKLWIFKWLVDRYLVLVIIILLAAPIPLTSAALFETGWLVCGGAG
jgi:hypothetical protein